MTREEFEQLLIGIFYSLAFPSNTMNFQKSFLTNSKEDIDSFAVNYLRAQGRIAFYLNEWDNAPDQPSKDAVAGSVDGDLGSASVNPEDAYLWPPTLGHFGDVKGPVDINNVSRTYSTLVDGTTTGNTSIFTVPSGKRFVPQIASFTVIDVAGLALVSTCSMGTNSSSYNNIMGATLLTGLSTQNNRLASSLTGVVSTASPSQEVFCRVSIASTATTYNILASLTGFLFDV